MEGRLLAFTKGLLWLLWDAQIVKTRENTSLPFDSQLFISQQENKFK